MKVIYKLTRAGDDTPSLLRVEAPSAEVYKLLAALERQGFCAEKIDIEEAARIKRRQRRLEQRQFETD